MKHLQVFSCKTKPVFPVEISYNPYQGLKLSDFLGFWSQLIN
ncbi:hypothetical protein PL8927_790087 [Planktothrix serta PCC 8927]|uniref:Uncharacterized protein n=1 Tax=Planktothrix serta PCC 8927 TaxID=671068 RepID=A0A7Z9C2I1_9CYAN|nr:hypothetical protein PL8927_790087 [Planktothrix serta PCC 8927]